MVTTLCSYVVIYIIHLYILIYNAIRAGLTVNRHKKKRNCIIFSHVTSSETHMTINIAVIWYRMHLYLGCDTVSLHLIKLVNIVVKVVQDIKDIGALVLFYNRIAFIFDSTMTNDTDIAVVIAYMIYFYMQECLFNTQGHSWLPALFNDRLDWGRIVGRHGTRASFKRHLCMSLSSFNKLLSYISPELEVDILQSSRREGAILPEIKLYCTIRW
jgi:hypothetical protein